MKKEEIKKIKERLEKEKKETEKQLETFADRDGKLEGDWDTRFPHWNGDSGSAALERAADEVEEYSRLLPLEHLLELRLKNINSALDRIKKGQYGICEKCGKNIPSQRLKVHLEAAFCLQCQKK